MLRLDEPDEEEPVKKGKAHAAVMPEKRYMRPQEPEQSETEEPYQDADEEAYFFDDYDEEEEQRILMEARARAEAEQAERMWLAQEVRAYEAEQARLAQEAYEAEQARLAQEEYERQMAEYERQKAQYERELAEYERQKAAYEVQLAAQEMTRAASSLRRRRTAAGSESEEMEMTRVQAPVRVPAQKGKKAAVHHASTAAKHEKRTEKKPEAKRDKSDGLIGRMAKMIEPEEEELIVRKTLPPRVDMNDAFRTAKLPVVTLPKDSRRRKG